jgi:hypothetical protein
MHKRSSFVSDNDSVNVMTSGAAETWFETRLGAFTIRSAVEIRKTYCLVGSYVRLEVKGSSLYTHNKTSKSLRRNDVGVIVEVNDCRPPPQSRYLENEASTRDIGTGRSACVGQVDLHTHLALSNA